LGFIVAFGCAVLQEAATNKIELAIVMRRFFITIISVKVILTVLK